MQTERVLPIPRPLDLDCEEDCAHGIINEMSSTRGPATLKFMGCVWSSYKGTLFISLWKVLVAHRLPPLSALGI